MIETFRRIILGVLAATGEKWKTVTGVLLCIAGLVAAGLSVALVKLGFVPPANGNVVWEWSWMIAEASGGLAVLGLSHDKMKRDAQKPLQ